MLRRNDVLYSSIVSCILTCLCLFPSLALAWPATGQWIPFYRNGLIVQDANGDAQDSRNIVSDSTHAAEFIFNDGDYIYFRLRLDADPTGSGGQGLLKQFGWGVEFDTNQNEANYEWLILIDGISQSETITLQQNTIQGTLGDPGDKTEFTRITLPLSGNYQVNLAETSFNGDQDYFLDWRFPYTTLKQVTGLTDNNPIRVFGGSSSSANSLTENGADLAGASDLYAGFSDYITPLGAVITTATIRFVADLAGNGDVTQTSVTSTAFIRVDDRDRNYDATTLQSVTVTLTGPGGDTETITLTETGINTGIFTGSIPVRSHTAITPSNTFFEVLAPSETVVVTYIEPIDANLQLNRARIDNLIVLSPRMILTKTVTPAETVPGSQVTYTISVQNTGAAAGALTSITDTLDTGFVFVTGSTSGLTSSNPLISGQNLNWLGSWSVPAGNSVTLSFKAIAPNAPGEHRNQVNALGANFGAVSSGPTAPVLIGVPALVISKSVDKTVAAPGEELIYTLTFFNQGSAAAQTLAIVDAVPMHTTFVPGSLRVGGAASTYDTATEKTDASSDDEAGFNGSSIFCTVGPISKNDGVPGAGSDEGKCYFKVKIN